MNEFEQLVSRIEAALLGLIRLAGEAQDKVSDLTSVQAGNALSKELKESAESLTTLTNALRYAGNDRGLKTLERGVERINTMIEKLGNKSSLRTLNAALNAQKKVMQEIVGLGSQQRSAMDDTIKSIANAAESANTLLRSFQGISQAADEVASKVSNAIKSFNFDTATRQLDSMTEALNGIDVQKYERLRLTLSDISSILSNLNTSGLDRLNNVTIPDVTVEPKQTPKSRSTKVNTPPPSNAIQVAIEPVSAETPTIADVKQTTKKTRNSVSKLDKLIASYDTEIDSILKQYSRPREILARTFLSSRRNTQFVNPSEKFAEEFAKSEALTTKSKAYRSAVGEDRSSLISSSEFTKYIEDVEKLFELGDITSIKRAIISHGFNKEDIAAVQQMFEDQISKRLRELDSAIFDAIDDKELNQSRKTKGDDFDGPQAALLSYDEAYEKAGEFLKGLKVGIDKQLQTFMAGQEVQAQQPRGRIRYPLMPSKRDEDLDLWPDPDAKSVLRDKMTGALISRGDGNNGASAQLASNHANAIMRAIANSPNRMAVIGTGGNYQGGSMAGGSVGGTLTTGNKAIDAQINGDVTFDHVTLAYEDADGQIRLADVLGGREISEGNKTGSAPFGSKMYGRGSENSRTIFDIAAQSNSVVAVSLNESAESAEQLKNTMLAMSDSTQIYSFSKVSTSVLEAGQTCASAFKEAAETANMGTVQERLGTVPGLSDNFNVTTPGDIMNHFLGRNRSTYYADRGMTAPPKEYKGVEKILKDVSDYFAKLKTDDNVINRFAKNASVFVDSVKALGTTGLLLASDALDDFGTSLKTMNPKLFDQIGEGVFSLSSSLRNWASDMIRGYLKGSTSPEMAPAAHRINQQVEDMPRTVRVGQDHFTPELRRIRSILESVDSRLSVITMAQGNANPHAIVNDVPQSNSVELMPQAMRAGVAPAMSKFTGSNTIDTIRGLVKRFLYVTNEFSAIMNGLETVVAAMRDLNPGTMIDLGSGLLKMIRGAQNVGHGLGLGINPARQATYQTANDVWKTGALAKADMDLLDKIRKGEVKVVNSDGSAVNAVTHNDINKQKPTNLEGIGQYVEDLLDPYRKASENEALRASQSPMNVAYDRVLKGQGESDEALRNKILSTMKSTKGGIIDVIRSKIAEQALLGILQDTEFSTSSFQGAGVNITSTETMQRILRKVYGTDKYDDIASSSAGLALPVKNKETGRVSTSTFINADNTNKVNSGETLIHELIHNMVNTLAQEPVLKKGLLTQNVQQRLDERRSSVLQDKDAIKNITTGDSHFARGVGKELAKKNIDPEDLYYYTEKEAFSYVGQAMVTTDEAFRDAVKAAYGDELYNDIAKSLKRLAPQTFGDDVIQNTQKNLKEYGELITRLTSRGFKDKLENLTKGELLQLLSDDISIVDMRPQVEKIEDAVSDKAQDAVDEVKQVFESAQINASPELKARFRQTIESLRDAVISNIGDSSDLKTVFNAGMKGYGEGADGRSQAFSRLINTTSIREAIANAVRGNLKDIDLQKILIDGLQNTLEIDQTALIKAFAPAVTTIGQKEFSFEAGRQVAALAGIKPNLNNQYFDDFQRTFQKESGDSLSRYGFNVEERYDMEKGVTVLSATARTSTGAITEMTAEVDRMGRVSVQTADKFAVLTTFVDRFKKEVPDELVEEFLFSIIAGVQNLFQSIMDIQDEIAEVGILMEDSLDMEGSVAELEEAADKMSMAFVAAAIDAAARTGQGFEEAVATSIQNFKVLGSVRDIDERTQLAQNLTDVQLGAQTVFGISLDQSLEALPAIYAQLRDTMTDADETAGERARQATEALEGLMDKFVVARRESGAAGEDLITVYSRLASSAADIGLNPDDLLSLTAAASVSLGKTADETANSLKFFIERVYSQQGAAALKDYGVAIREVGEDGIPVFKDLNEIIDDINASIAVNPGSSKGISQALGGRARAGEVSAILRSRPEATRIGDVLENGVEGFEFEEDIEAKRSKFTGSINTLKANLGQFIELTLFSSGALVELGNSLVALSNHLKGVANAISENEGGLEFIKATVLTIGEAVIFMALNAGRAFTGAFGGIIKLMNTIRRTTSNVLNTFGKEAESPAIRVARAVESAANAYLDLGRDATAAGAAGTTMASQMAASIQKLIADVKELNAELARLATVSASVEPPSALAVNASGSGKPKNSIQLNTLVSSDEKNKANPGTIVLNTIADSDKDDPKKNDTGSVVLTTLASSEDEIVNAALKQSVEESADSIKKETTERAAATVATTAAKASTTELTNQTNGATTGLRRFTDFLRGVQAKQVTGMPNFFGTEKGQRFSKVTGVAADMALPIITDLLIDGASPENLTKIGVSIAGGVLGSLTGPMGTVIGYTIGGAIADSMDVYGMFGFSTGEKESSVRSLIGLSKEDKLLIEKFGQSDLFKATKDDLQFQTREVTGTNVLWGEYNRLQNASNGSEWTHLNPYNQTDMNVAGQFDAFDPRLIEIMTELGLDNVGEFYEIVSQIGTKGTEINELFEQINAETAEINENTGLYNDYFGSLSETLDGIDTRLSSIAEKNRNLFSNIETLPAYGAFGLGQQAINDQYSSQFDSINNGSITGDQASQVMQNYDVARQSLNSMPEVIAMAEPMQDILGQTFTDLHQQLFDIGATGQSAFLSMISPLSEMITYTQEYEELLRSIEALEAQIEVESQAAGADPDELVAAREQLANLQEQRDSRSSMAAVYAQYLAMVKASPGMLQGELDMLLKQEKARQTITIPGTAAQFRMPSIIDAEGSTIDDIQAALAAAKKKQEEIVKMFPEMAEEFAKEQFLLESGNQRTAVTGVSQSYYQEALDNIQGSRNQQQNLTAPDNVDMRGYTEEEYRKILADARAMQDQAVALAPDLADEYADSRLLLMRDNNDILIENGLSQEYLRAAIEANTESTDDNTDGLRGHYNLPSSYRAPTIWDYYNEGGTETGTNNFVPPPGMDQGSMVPIELANEIANAVLQQGNKDIGDETILPDLSQLGSLVDPNAAPLGYPEPGSPGKVIIPPELDVDSILANYIAIKNAPKPLKGDESGLRTPDTFSKPPVPDGGVEEDNWTPVTEEGMRELQAELDRLSGKSDESTKSLSFYDNAVQSASQSVDQASGSFKFFDSGLTNLTSVTQTQSTKFTGTLNTTDLRLNGFNDALQGITQKAERFDFIRALADSINSGAITINVNTSGTTATVVGGGKGAQGPARARGGNSYAAGPATGDRNRV